MSDLTPILRLLHSSDEHDRRQGILELIRSGDQMTVPILSKLAAEDPSVEVRYYARRALGSLKGRVGTVEQASTPGMPDIPVRDLIGSDNPHIRFEGLKKALADPSQENLRLVRRGLERETNPALRASFVVGVGRLGDEDEVDLLAGYLRDPDSRVRANAVEALATIGSEAACIHLVPMLQEEDNRVRANAVKALQAFGGAPLLALLRRMASEGEVWMRDSALYALTHFKSPHAIAVIAGMATENEPLDRLREKALETLQTLAGSGNTAAAEWLGKLGKTVAAPPVAQPIPPSITQPIVQPITPPIAQPGALPIATPPPPPTTPPSTSPVADLHKPVETAPPIPGSQPPAIAVSQVPAAADSTPAGLVPAVPLSAEPTPAFKPEEALQASDIASRQQALLWMTEHATAEDAPLLVARLSQESEPLLLAMILSLLRRLKVREGFDAALSFLESRDDRVRANAVEALSTIDPERSLPYLHPLLKDPNNRVRANVIHALCADELFEPVEPLRTLVEDPREVHRRSALYVISLIRRPGFVEFLDRLLDDPEAVVRDMSFAILEEYQNAGIRGAKEVYERISARIKLDRERDRYFQNQFDEVFSVVVTAVSASEQGNSPHAPADRKAAAAEAEALLKLGRKAEECGMLPPEIAAEIERTDRERQDAEKRIGEASAEPSSVVPVDVSGETIPGPPDPHDAGSGRLQPGLAAPNRGLAQCKRPISKGIARAAEIDRLQSEVKKLAGYRDGLLVRVGRRLVRDRSGLQPEQRAALDPELKGALVQASVHVPSASVSLLPPLDASPTEIFDLTLRLYQKHVVAFSLVPGGIVACCFAFIFVAAFMTGVLSIISKPLGMLFVIVATLSGSVFLAFAYGGFTWIVTCMIRQFVEGRTPDYGKLLRESFSEVWPVTWLQVRKGIRLIGWGIFASVMAYICVGPLKPILQGDVFGRAVLKLVALAAFFTFFGRPFINYLLVEPWFILEGRRNGGDPFVESTELVTPIWGRTFLLFALANLLSSLITGTTTEVLDLLPANKAIAFLKGAVGTASFVCLYALAYANLVVFTMMLLAARRRAPRPGTAS